MISWPCMLTLDGDDELTYLHSLHDFNLVCCEFIFSDDDYVVDSVGRCYIIEFTQETCRLTTQDRVLTAAEATGLIRGHEFSKASVCLSKIQFLTVGEAIKSLL